MNARFVTSLGFALSVLILSGGLFAARAVSDLQPPQKRQATIGAAQRLAQPTPPQAVPEDLSSPFNPTDFDRPEGAETTSNTAKRPVAPTTPLPPPPPADLEILEALAAQLTPTGTIKKGN